MKVRLSRTGVMLSLFGAVVLAAVGCSGDNQPGTAKDKSTKGTATVAQEKKANDHSGWWCDEHGIPEAECTMCSKKVAREFKAKGDWCDQHDRAKSQCFICDPKLKEKYAAVYRAKLGKEPPPTEDEEQGKKDAKSKQG